MRLWQPQSGVDPSEYAAVSQELWAPHPTLPIFVSNLGRIIQGNRILTRLSKETYPRVIISGKRYPVAHLVLHAFIGERSQRIVYLGEPSDCRLCMLRWGEPKVQLNELERQELRSELASGASLTAVAKKYRISTSRAAYYKVPPSN